MKHSFIDLLSQPDSVLFQFEDSGVRFEEADGREEQSARMEYRVENNAGAIILYPSKRPLKRVKFRWRGNMSDCFVLTGDALERIYDSSTAAWTGMIPQRKLPWYFQVYDGEKLNCFGVKTGADAICYFQCDDGGITLWAEDGGWHYFDKTITNATMLKNLYQRIQKAAGTSVVIGCNTVNHLVAGIHAAQRSSEDTSGRYFEMTRLNGCASFIRLPQNRTFFSMDPDCAAFTERVPIKENLDFLELCAVTGCITFASVTPGILKGQDLARIREIYRIASRGGMDAVPVDWLGHNVCSRFETPDGTRFQYDWYQYYDGVRSFWTGLN